MTAEAPARYLLPPEAYWSEDWFDLEQRRLFSHTWHLAAAESEVASPGDFVTLNAGYDPLVVVRGLDRQLRCFHNLCRHRGMVLLDGAGNTRTGITCPYHFWNYALDGDLRKVPQQEEQFGTIDLADWGLVPASVATWGGMVFAHPDAGAPPVDDWMDGLPAHIGSFRPELLTQVAHERLEAGCNWKLFVENHVDVLHLWYLHARTLGDYDHHQFEWKQLGRSWVSYEPPREGLDGRRRSGATSKVRHINERDSRGIGAHAAFPNVLMASERDYFITYVATPVGPDRTVVDLRIRAEADSDPETLVRAASSFMLEDIQGCERVQAGIRSSRFAVGPLASEHERPITLFQQNLLDALADGSTGVAHAFDRRASVAANHHG